METVQPDIVVTSPEGDYLIIVEVKLNDVVAHNPHAIEQLKRIMVSLGCSIGLLICGDRIVLLRDSLERFNGESIEIVGEARLPDALLPPGDDRWNGHRGFEFESRVQRWLEDLKLAADRENLPPDLRQLLSDPIMSLLKIGEIRAGGPRWSKVPT